MAKFRFFGCAKKNNLQPITDQQIKEIKLAQDLQYKRIEILYNQKTIEMLKNLTGVTGSDASIFNAFIKKVSNEYRPD